MVAFFDKMGVYSIPMVESNNIESSDVVSNNHIGEVDTTRPTRRKKKGKTAVYAIIIIIILLLLGGAAWFLLKEPDVETETNTQTSLSTPNTIKEPTNTPIPTATPQPVDKSEIAVQVLNGSGVSGEAGFLQGELEKLGFSDIEVGNADEQDQTKTTVTFQSNLSQTVVEEVTEKLESIYQSVDTKKTSTGEYEIQIIVGLRKNQGKPTVEPTEAKSTSTPSPTGSSAATPTP